MSCGKAHLSPEKEAQEMDARPTACLEYEEMKANGEDVSRDDHSATCTCPIVCHFDDLK